MARSEFFISIAVSAHWSRRGTAVVAYQLLVFLFTPVVYPTLGGAFPPCSICAIIESRTHFEQLALGLLVSISSADLSISHATARHPGCLASSPTSLSKGWTLARDFQSSGEIFSSATLSIHFFHFVYVVQLRREMCCDCKQSAFQSFLYAERDSVVIIVLQDETDIFTLIILSQPVCCHRLP